MKIVIQPYTAAWEPAVADFNQRLAPQRTTVHFQFPERCLPDWLPQREDRRIRQEYFLAIEGEATVRGGYVLKTQDFWIDGDYEAVGNLQLPLSEGIVDSRYSFVGAQLTLSALKQQPMLYSLGMGGLNNPYPRLLSGLKWSMYLVPFFFRIVKPTRFLREMPVLRSTATRRLGANLLAISGVGSLGTHLIQRMSAAAQGRGALACDIEPHAGFGEWADKIWDDTHRFYSLIGVRDRGSLEVLYDSDAFSGMSVLRISRHGEDIGWVAVRDTAMFGHRQFGNLRVGSIVDGLCAPDSAAAMVSAATSFLENRGVDVIVSNQSHRAWARGLKVAGYLRGARTSRWPYQRRWPRKSLLVAKGWGISISTAATETGRSISRKRAIQPQLERFFSTRDYQQ